MTIKYVTKCAVKYKGYIINRTMYRPTVYTTKFNEIIVNSNERMQIAIGSMPTAHRQAKGEVGRSGIVLRSSNVTITKRRVANIIKREILGKKKAK